MHGLGSDPADGTLYAATHFGVFAIEEDGSAERVADRWQDTMAFTVAGPGRFLASGHPDLREDLPAHLGLIESTDAAQTWTPVSLQGEVDFHALEIAGDRLYGYDATRRLLLTTLDQQAWLTLARISLIDLAADPGDPTRLLATVRKGQLVELDLEDPQPRPVTAAPALAYLDWPEPDTLLGLAPDGTVYRSTDAATSWQALTDLPGQPQAVDATPTRWHVATSEGIYASRDMGETWEKLLG